MSACAGSGCFRARLVSTTFITVDQVALKSVWVMWQFAQA